MTLKEFRKQKGLSQTELANRVGLKQTTISQYENGFRRPNLHMAKKLADALGMSLDDFFFAFQHFKMKYNSLYAMEVKRKMSNITAKVPAGE